MPKVAVPETDDRVRAIAERVFASETKDEDVREEISLFDVADDCPILNQELAYHVSEDDDIEKRKKLLSRTHHELEDQPTYLEVLNLPLPIHT
ncbi:hypothetical protein PO909_018693 [Leuciscus waleckii]